MAKPSTLAPAKDDPRPNARWEVIYRDMFDRSDPARAEVTGRGLVPGLIELWARFLFETVQSGSSRGFSEFTLTIEGVTIDITGSLVGGQQLQRWAFPNKSSYGGVLDGADLGVLRALAETHAASGSLEQASLALLDAAEAAGDAAAFLVRLGELRKRWSAP